MREDTVEPSGGILEECGVVAERLRQIGQRAQYRFAALAVERAGGRFAQTNQPVECHLYLDVVRNVLRASRDAEWRAQRQVQRPKFHVHRVSSLWYGRRSSTLCVGEQR